MTESEKAVATVQAVRAVLGERADDNRDPAVVLSMLRTVVETYYPAPDPSAIDLGGGMTLHLATDPAARLSGGALDLLLAVRDR